MAKSALRSNFNHSESSRSSQSSLRSRTSVFNTSVTLYELDDVDESKTNESTLDGLGRSSGSSSSKKSRTRSSNNEDSGSVSSPRPAKRVKLEVKEEERELSSSGSIQTVSPAKSKSKSPRKPRISKSEPASVSPPPNWRLVYDKIAEMRYSATGCAKDAAVDTMGCHSAGEGEEQPGPEGEKNKRFSILISLMLSSQTKDVVTHTAVNNLRLALKSHSKDGSGTLSASDLASAPPSLILSAISKVGFYNRKAGYIQQVAVKCRDDYGGDVPKTLEELLEFTGVGKKMAYLMLGSAWGLNIGIGVDVHVHRITNRLGWHKPTTKTPEETRLSLESWLPLELHPKINHLLVGFGQTVCTAVKPKCTECSLSANCSVEGIEGGTQVPLCPSANITGTKPKTKAKQIIKTKVEAKVTRIIRRKVRETETETDVVGLNELELGGDSETVQKMDSEKFQLGESGDGEPSIKIELEDEEET
ncbi:DNA glycosylase [Gymnopus androsaceus JB14]|uniref:Endonuclease III homolog n=1 Tax=Gymnopus androsaceus JB14 TaxID=1447944 RepID=A0A6A4HI78_9AGAR|nr:DNA glycosylase [Gymnopus androsaceus JB14]